MCRNAVCFVDAKIKCPHGTLKRYKMFSLVTPGDAMKDFFAEAEICVGFAAQLVARGRPGSPGSLRQVRRPLFKAKMPPVQISKPIMNVESAEVEAAQAGRSMIQ